MRHRASRCSSARPMSGKRYRCGTRWWCWVQPGGSGRCRGPRRGTADAAVAATRWAPRVRWRTTTATAYCVIPRGVRLLDRPLLSDNSPVCSIQFISYWSSIFNFCSSLNWLLDDPFDWWPDVLQFGAVVDAVVAFACYPLVRFLGPVGDPDHWEELGNRVVSTARSFVAADGALVRSLVFRIDIKNSIFFLIK